MNPTAPVLLVLLVVASVVAPVAAAENEPPLVDAGLDQRAAEGSVVLLDGGGAVDPDGEIVSYEWSIETPRGETIRPEEPTAMLTRFEPERVGRYRVTLVATDDDGATGQDTLYVDVAVSAGEGGGGPDAADPGGGGGAPSINPPSDVLPAASGSDAVTTRNRPPVGQILGPDEVYAGETRRFVIQASDVDGRVVDYWWLKGAITGGDSLQFEPHRSGKSYTFDLEPGAVAEITAMVKDDDGARTRVSKEVRVLNNPPTVRIEGRNVISGGLVGQFVADASDQEGSIVSYAWSVKQSGVTVSQISDSMSTFHERLEGPKFKWYKFSSPNIDTANVELQVIVEDEHGGTGKATKIVEVEHRAVADPNESKPPRILTLDGFKTGISRESVFGTFSVHNPGQITFTAEARDDDSEELTYYWKFGGEGSAITIETSNPRSSSSTTFLFKPLEKFSKSIEITLRVEDSNGNSDSITRTLNLRMASSASYLPGGSIQIWGGPGPYNGIIEGVVTVKNTQNDDPGKVALHYGDGSKQVFEDETRMEGDKFLFDFHHQYERSGSYTLFIVDNNFAGASNGHRTIDVSLKQFTEWHYQISQIKRVTKVSPESPGENWELVRIESYERKLVDVERITIPTSESNKYLKPGKSWMNVGAKTKLKSVTETTVQPKKPGQSWELTEANVGIQTVRDGWSSITVDRRSLAQDNWVFVERKSERKLVVETEISVNRPSGNGWVRAGISGHRRSGFSTVWVNRRYLARPDWQYVRSERYVSGYSSSRYCDNWVTFKSQRSCVEWRVSSQPNWESRFLYRKPDFETVYKWKRTTEMIKYSYKYRYPTYQTVSVNRYSRERIQKIRMQILERRTYMDSPVYIWEHYENKTHSVTSINPPPSGATNIEKHKHNCLDDIELVNSSICQDSFP